MTLGPYWLHFQISSGHSNDFAIVGPLLPGNRSLLESDISLSKKDVVVLVALERWIEMDEIYGFVLDVTLKNVQVVTVAR